MLKSKGSTFLAIFNHCSCSSATRVAYRKTLAVVSTEPFTHLNMKVKPVIKLLKQTLLGTGALLVAAVSLFIFATPVEDFIQKTFVQKDISTSKTAAKSSIRKEELLRLPVEVMSDNDLAAAAAEAADGRPVYCRDRYYRALAGGQYCKWEDLLK